mgnify:CR=1 FL=1
MSETYDVLIIGAGLSGIGEVTASNDPDFKPGDIVSTMFGWREAFNAPAMAPAAVSAFTL